MRGKALPQTTMLTVVTPDALVPQGHPIRRIKPMVDRALAQLSPTFDRMYAANGRASIPLAPGAGRGGIRDYERTVRVAQLHRMGHRKYNGLVESPARVFLARSSLPGSRITDGGIHRAGYLSLQHRRKGTGLRQSCALCTPWQVDSCSKTA